MTFFGFTATHADDRLVDHRLGPPGALPVKLLFCTMLSSLSVSTGLSFALIADEKPT